MEEEEHEVYGGDIPDVGEMEGDVDPHHADVEMTTADDDAVKELDEMKKRLKEMEEEAAALREMQAKVEKEMGAVQDPASAAASQASREEVDTRSIFVGNVDGDAANSPRTELKWHRMPLVSSFTYSEKSEVSNEKNIEKVDYACTPEEVQQHFQSCGTVNRVTILTDKFGQPKGFAYVEFLEVEAVQEALALNESELHGRQLKVTISSFLPLMKKLQVMAKRTNVPGMKQYRGRRFNPYMGYRGFRRPYVPPYFYSPYGYGKVPRFRRPTRYMPYY
ncbi:Nucleotide-binding, alpha-beta plait [Cynara cardunculus var. scolymus]|uniref:Nucleotide-binding, alpha-beta plait n=1 Tax=Cynara cardunculus var. scolymus TaxID=59895 RepID=A0A103Y612_CYNCS|nr:Nucleotide-binding, alpha-beta plait [Cynara cardunculus var. scolymus]